jgi:hypothetical protein
VRCDWTAPTSATSSFCRPAMPRSPGAPRTPVDCPLSWCAGAHDVIVMTSKGFRRRRPRRTKRRWPGVGPDAVLLAVVASIRHVDTDYDDLLMSSVDRESARVQAHQRVEGIVNAWHDGVAMLDG